jgi:hypothetical protein
MIVSHHVAYQKTDHMVIKQKRKLIEDMTMPILTGKETIMQEDLEGIIIIMMIKLVEETDKDKAIEIKINIITMVEMIEIMISLIIAASMQMKKIKT